LAIRNVIKPEGSDWSLKCRNIKNELKFAIIWSEKIKGEATAPPLVAHIQK